MPPPRRPTSRKPRQTGPCHLPNELYDNLANRKPRVGPLAEFDGSLQSLDEAEDDALNSADRRLQRPQHSRNKGHSIPVAGRVGTALDTGRTSRWALGVLSSLSSPLSPVLLVLLLHYYMIFMYYMYIIKAVGWASGIIKDISLVFKNINANDLD